MDVLAEGVLFKRCATSLLTGCVCERVMLWTQKYKPILAEIPHDTKQLQDFVANFKKQKKKALFLHGPAGSGKTSAVYALAKQFGLELVEVNASDFRSADEINAKVGMALKQMSLFATGKIILVDELDGLSGKEDRGGVGALADLIVGAKFPVFLVANDPWDSKFSSLRSKSVMVEFPALSMTAMVPLLQKILAAEKVQADAELVKSLARRSGGDLRGAIIDAQTLAVAGFSAKGFEGLSEREKSESIMQVLVRILKSTDPKIALDALDAVDEDLNECMLWIDENLPKEYVGADLARAYDALSRADVFQGRIRKWQYWRYLVYVSALMSAGVAVAKDKKSAAFVQYQRTQRILKLWMAKQKYAKRTEIAQKLGRATHCSKSKALQGTLPLLAPLFKQKHASAAVFAQELKLEEEEVEWLQK